MSDNEKKSGPGPLNESYKPTTTHINTYQPDTAQGTYTPTTSGETEPAKKPPAPNKR